MNKRYYQFILPSLLLLSATSIGSPKQNTYAQNMITISQYIQQQLKQAPKTANTPIKNTYKTTDNQPQLSSSTDKNGDLSMTTFTMPILLNETIYPKPLNASWSDFTGSFEAYHITLNNGGNFNNSLFRKEAIFHKLKSTGQCDFSMDTFFGKVDFMGSLFFDNARFDGSVFYNDAVFLNTDFDGNATFSHSIFHKSLSLNHASFLQGLDLSYTTINNLRMDHTQVGNYINLQHININDEINLLTIEPIQSGKKILLNLVGDDISKINFTYSNFKLYFPDGTKKYETERIYRGLLDDFKKSGDIVSYNNLYQEFNEYRYKNSNAPVRFFLDKHVWNFGLEKNKVFIWLAFLFIIYTSINCLFYRNLIDDYINIDFLNKIDYSAASTLNGFQRIVFYTPYAFILTLSLCICLFLPGMGISTNNLKGKSIAVTSYLMLLPLTGFIFITFIIIFILRA